MSVSPRRSLFVSAFAAFLFAVGCSAAAPESRGASSGPTRGADKTVAVEAQARNPAPAFTLPDPDGVDHSLADYRGKWVVLEWVNHKCPFVRKQYDSKNMQSLQARYTAKGVVWLTICSSAPGKDGFETNVDWKTTLERKGAAPTAMLLDPDGAVGHAYGAKTTPHMFVIDPQGGIVYRGAIDDKRTTDVADVAKARCYVSEVLDAVTAGRPAPIAETAPYGCSVKY